MPEVIVFDVNETLLDVGALDPFFAERFGDAAVRREWFGQLLQSAFVTTITGHYRDFGTLGMGALAMVASRHGSDITAADRSALGAGMRALPPHPDVRPALERLREAGLR
ncbi:MAG: haloacid dehalogenase type II, partial [Chloroflexota bacterium]|nr:haloacid dehalogenase type II [Chloroflexota bacterium]